MSEYDEWKIAGVLPGDFEDYDEWVIQKSNGACIVYHKHINHMQRVTLIMTNDIGNCRICNAGSPMGVRWRASTTKLDEVL